MLIQYKENYSTSTDCMQGTVPVAAYDALDRLCTVCNTYHATLAKLKLAFLQAWTGKSSVTVKICSSSAVNTASGSSTRDRVPSHLY